VCADRGSAGKLAHIAADCIDVGAVLDLLFHVSSDVAVVAGSVLHRVWGIGWRLFG
jgi:hypothetical protein